MKNGLSVLLAGVMATSLFGCSSNEPKEQVKLTIAAAASLENAFEDELIPMFEHGSYKQSKRIYKKMLEAKVIVFASPVYFYTFNASMKLLIDRTFAIEKTIHDKDFYLLTTGLAPEESYFRIIKDTFQKYIDCLRVGGNRFVDSILGFQTGNKDDIEKTNALEKAYNMAKAIKINE